MVYSSILIEKQENGKAERMIKIYLYLDVPILKILK